MANDKTYDRHINIWINGKEVNNDVKSIRTEVKQLTNDLETTTRGTKEYNEKVQELRKARAILKEHQEAIANTGTAWDKVKSLFTGAQGLIMAGVGGILVGFNSIKGIIESTDTLGDKWEKTLGGWKSGIDAIKISIASMDFKDFGKKIKDAIEEGRRYAESQDRISDSLRALKMRESEVASEILKQRAIENSVLQTRDKRIAAGLRAQALEEELEKTRTAIAKERLNTELENAMVITGQSPNVIEAYLKQDEKLMKLLETGQQYMELQKQIDIETSKITDRVSTMGTYNLDKSVGQPLNDIIIALQNQQKALGPYAKEYSDMWNGLGKLADEKKDIIVAAYTDLKNAETSGLENTLKIRTKTDNLIAQGTKSEQDAAVAKVKAEREAALETMQINGDVAEYLENLDKAYFKRQEDKKKQANEAAVESVQIMADVDEYLQKLDEDYFKREEKNNEKKLKAKEKFWQEMQNETSAAMGFESVLFDRQFAKLEQNYQRDVAAAGDNAALKAQIDEKYARKKRELARRAAIGEKLTAIFTIGVDTAVGIAKATAEGILGWWQIPLIIAAGALQTAAVLAKPIPTYATGGFTRRGGKHEPAGIVHAGEYVVPSQIVSNPDFSGMLNALEFARVNGNRGFAGGGPADRKALPGSSAGADPEMKAIMAGIYGFLKDLKRDGVKNKWPWKDIDNMRTGMGKISDIEGKVSK